MHQKTHIFHYSTHYDSLTRVTRLKIAVNMSDPTCLFLEDIIGNCKMQNCLVHPDDLTVSTEVLLLWKGHWTSITPSPTFSKKVGIFIPFEVLVWVMTACQVLHSRLIWFWRNMNICSIFYFSKSTSINTQYSSLWDTLKMVLFTKYLIKWKRIGRISWKFQYWFNLKFSMELVIKRYMLYLSNAPDQWWYLKWWHLFNDDTWNETEIWIEMMTLVQWWYLKWNRNLNFEKSDRTLRRKKIIVWLSSTTFFEKGRVGGFFFFFFRFFFSNRSPSYMEL